MQSNSPLEDPERLRYLEHFQKILVRDGTEDFLSEQKRWFELNRSRLASEFDALASSPGDVVTALDNPFLSYQDKTAYDSVFARQIFSPILSKALEASIKLGYAIHRSVILANAPSIEPSPYGVASTDFHMLFIGQGTSGFCNYWAKIFSAIIYRVGTISTRQPPDDAVMTAIRTDPALMQAVRLVLHYARRESLLGFGELKQEPHLLQFRMLLVQGMETFIVGHELGHFFLHEQFPELNGIPPNSTLQEVELLCDAIGFAICSSVGNSDGNEISKHLSAPLLLLYALKLSEDVEGILLGLKPKISDTHPTLAKRIQGLFMFAKITDPSGSLNSSLEETLNYAVIVGAQVKSVLMSLKADTDCNV